MAYIPPSRRPGFSAPPPLVNRAPARRQQLTARRHNEVDIQKAPQYTRRVLIEQWKNNEEEDDSILVDFVPAKFSESYAFLDDKVLFVIAPARAHGLKMQAPLRSPETKANISGNSSAISFDDFGSALNAITLTNIPDSIPSEEEQGLKRAVLKTVTRIAPCLTEALSLVQAGAFDLKPNTALDVNLIVRFGTLLVYSPTRKRSIKRLNPVGARTLERHLIGEMTMGEPILRSLETSLPEPVFEQIEQVADSDAHYRTPSVKKYSIQVLDEHQPGMMLKLTCVPVDDEDHGEAGTGSSQLKIIKVKSDHKRYMCLDICPLGCETDFRIILTSQVNFVKLEEDMRAGLQDIVDKAIVDPSADGGLRWPLGSIKLANSKVEGRFAVRGVRHSKEGSNYRNSERKWKFRTVNGGEFHTSKGRKSKEVEMVPVKWSQLLKAKIPYKPPPPVVEDEKETDENAGAGNGIASSAGGTVPWNTEDIVGELPGLLEWLATHIP